MTCKSASLIGSSLIGSSLIGSSLIGSSLIGSSLIAIAAVLGVSGAAHADALLTGAITSAAGEKMGGVTVSAKAEGGRITTSVFTDESGNYYFPPLPEGKYKVWAQALTFHTGNGSVDLNKTTHQN